MEKYIVSSIYKINLKPILYPSPKKEVKMQKGERISESLIFLHNGVNDYFRNLTSSEYLKIIL